MCYVAAGIHYMRDKKYVSNSILIHLQIKSVQINICHVSAIEVLVLVLFEPPVNFSIKLIELKLHQLHIYIQLNHFHPTCRNTCKNHN